MCSKDCPWSKVTKERQIVVIGEENAANGEQIVFVIRRERKR